VCLLSAAPVVVGQGKKHGRYWLDDGVLDSTQVPSLSQIRAETPSGGPAIRQRPSPSQQKIVALEAENKRLNEEVANHAKQLAEIKAFLQSQNGGGGLCSVLMRVLLSQPWVRITHLNCKQATDLCLRQAMPGKLLHQTTSFPSTSSLLSLFAA